MTVFAGASFPRNRALPDFLMVTTIALKSDLVRPLGSLGWCAQSDAVPEEGEGVLGECIPLARSWPFPFLSCLMAHHVSIYT